MQPHESALKSVTKWTTSNIFSNLHWSQNRIQFRNYLLMREQSKRNRHQGSGQMGLEKEGRCWPVYQMRGSKNANYLKKERFIYLQKENISQYI